MARISSDDLKNFMSAYDHAVVFDDDRDGAADTDIVTFCIARAYNRVEHYNPVGWSTTMKFEAELIIAAYYAFLRIGMSVPDDLKELYNEMVEMMKTDQAGTCLAAHDPSEEATTDMETKLLYDFGETDV